MTAKLDARVALEIMDWTRPPNLLPAGRWESEQPATTWPGRLIHCETGQSVSASELLADRQWQAPDGTYHEHPPAYSSDWGLAGELLTHLHSEDYVICIVSKIKHDDWLVCIGAPEGGDASNGDGPFPKAVCQAALRAKEARDGT